MDIAGFSFGYQCEHGMGLSSFIGGTNYNSECPDCQRAFAQDVEAQAANAAWYAEQQA